MSKGQIRIKVREQGPMVNAWLEVPGREKEEFLIGSVAVAAMKADPEVERMFHDILQRTIKIMFKEFGLPEIEGFSYQEPDTGHGSH